MSGGFAARGIYANPVRSARSPQPSGSQQPVRPGPANEPGPARVTLTASAARHPDHEAVRTLLQNHFESINLLRYDLWTTTVVPRKQSQQPEREWRSAYASTQDGTIVVHRIVPGPRRSVRVMLTFTSTQDPADAPATMPVKCLRWRVTYQVVRYQGGLRLGVGRPASSLFRPC